MTDSYITERERVSKEARIEANVIVLPGVEGFKVVEIVKEEIIENKYLRIPIKIEPNST